MMHPTPLQWDSPNVVTRKAWPNVDIVEDILFSSKSNPRGKLCTKVLRVLQKKISYDHLSDHGSCRQAWKKYVLIVLRMCLNFLHNSPQMRSLV